jgi:uncharacterized protein with HEPN domain
MSELASQIFRGAASRACGDVLSHAYFSIDLDIVWNVISVEVPNLLPQLRRLRTTVGCNG